MHFVAAQGCSFVSLLFQLGYRGTGMTIHSAVESRDSDRANCGSALRADALLIHARSVRPRIEPTNGHERSRWARRCCPAQVGRRCALTLAQAMASTHGLAPSIPADKRRPLAHGLLIHAFSRALVLGKAMFSRMTFTGAVGLTRDDLRRADDTMNRSGALGTRAQCRIREPLEQLDTITALLATLVIRDVLVDWHAQRMRPCRCGINREGDGQERLDGVRRRNPRGASSD